MTKKNNAYEDIGKYIIWFQEIPLILQAYIISILNNEYGLKKQSWDSEREDIIARILLSERSVDHLLKIFLSLIWELFWKETNDFIVTKKIIDFISNDILPHRNDIVHSFLVVDQKNTENIRMCREKFKAKIWFDSLKNIPTNHLEKQTEKIKNVCLLLHYIWKNIEMNKKICWRFKYGNIEINISLDTINKQIEALRKLS